MNLEIQCEICGYSSKSLTKHIHKEHNLNAKEYKRLYPNSLVTITPRQKEYWIKRGYNIEQSIEKALQISYKNSNRNYEFYYQKGFSKEESKKWLMKWL